MTEQESKRLEDLLDAWDGPAKASLFLERLISNNPNDPESHFKLAEVLAKRTRFAAALGEYRVAGQLDYDEAQVHLGLGKVYAQQGKHAEALTEFKLALEGNPQSAEIYQAAG